MPADKGFHDAVMDLLAPLGEVRSRAMFGGYGIFHEDDMFALISGSTLFLRIDDSTRSKFEQAGSRQHRPMPYYSVPPEVMQDGTKLHEWARTAIDTAHAMPKKKAGKGRPLG
ncbi:MAG: TfoX/Sxy family protein [Chloroflexota bacterium]|nr:TfoX/Sxy family protein [Chloroflexota bacterium]